MKKTLISAAIIASCTMVNAQSDMCNYSTDYNIKIDEQSVQFNKKSGDSFVFENDQLMINGDAVKLNDEQMAASRELQSRARLMVPKIAMIAVEGAELGVKSATMVLNGLFGDDADIQHELIEPIEAISEKIKANISATELNTESLEKSLEDAFDDEFEKVIETAATKYSGKIISNVISSIFSSDEEEIKDLEFRMENMGQDIERYVEENSKELEVKAKALCDDVVLVDQFDNLLTSVEGYPKDGLIQKDKESGFNFSHLSFNDDHSSDTKED